MTTVVGKPIPVAKNPSPTQEEIASTHAKYVAALKDLYDRNAAEYHPRRFGPPPELRLVE
ncbi:diacylglycerol O-acyltransferase 1 [Entomophthora muscae]|nr:diacylglycerol O-acyltransferase 1 [Entomophthora muscae]